MHTLLANGSSYAGMKYFTWNEVLSPYIFIFYIAYIVAFLFTPIVRHIAIHYGIIDEPDAVRKLHTRPVAYLGGVAVFLGWLSGLALSQFVAMHHIQEGMSRHLVVNFGIVVGACTIIFVGLWDDIFRMSPWKKIAGQIAAAICLLATGIGHRAAWIFMKPILVRTSAYLGFPDMSGIPPEQVAAVQQAWAGHWAVQVISVIFVIVLVVLCCNATNLMDGLDGLCGGVTALVSAGFLFLAVSRATTTGAINANEDALQVVLGLALLGGVLGFVPFNFNPASIFMGDTGSMFLGFACATMMILFASTPEHFKWFLASMIMFSLPILDTALAFTRRWVNGRPVFSPDRFHFHHQLVARGFSVKQTVIISYALSIGFCLLGSAVVFIRTRYAVAIYLVVFGSIIVAAYKMGMVHERVSERARRPWGKPALPPVAPAESEKLPVPAFSDTSLGSAGWRPPGDARADETARP